jgi:hypothetical protein
MAIACAWGTECVTGMNSTSNGPILRRSPSATDDELGLAQQPGLFDAIASQAEGDGRSEDGKAQLAQQVVQRTDVILVAVRGDDALDAVGVLAQPREIGQHEIDAVHVGSGNISPQSISSTLPCCSIAMQFRPISPRPPRKTTRTGSAISEHCDHSGRSGKASRHRCRLAKTCGARESTNSGAVAHGKAGLADRYARGAASWPSSESGSALRRRSRTRSSPACGC